MKKRGLAREQALFLYITMPMIVNYMNQIDQIVTIF